MRFSCVSYKNRLRVVLQIYNFGVFFNSINIPCEADEEGVASVTSEFLFNVAVCSETADVDVAIAVEGVIMVIL